MKNIRRLQHLCFFYVALNLTFMLVWTPLTGTFDAFPLFTWNIFRPYPESLFYHHILKVKAVDGVTYSEPMDLKDLSRSDFPNIRYYDFSHRVVRAGDAIREGEDELAQRLVAELDEELMQFHVRVHYIIESIKISPVPFLREGKFEDKKIVVDKVLEKANE